MISRKTANNRKLFYVIASIAGCVFLVLVLIQMLGYESSHLQMHYNDWRSKRIPQSTTKSIGYGGNNQIPEKENENETRKISNIQQEKPSESSNKNCPNVDSWIDLKTEEMTPEQLINYFVWPNSSSCQLGHYIGGTWFPLPPRGIAGQKLVCIQPTSLAPPPGSCIVYSFGINYDWSFDDAMEQYGCQVFAFDPSMRDVEQQFNRTRGVHFYKIGLGTNDETSKEGWIVRSLESIRGMLNHRDTIIDYFKMDIEYSEWPVLRQWLRTGELSKIRQLGVEIHLPEKWSLKKYRERADVLRSMERDHGMVRFGSQINPWFKGNFTELGGIEISLGYEMAWYNKKFLFAG